MQCAICRSIYKPYDDIMSERTYHTRLIIRSQNFSVNSMIFVLSLYQL